MLHLVDKVRIDKWLWSVRIFKTRTQASDACSSGKVKIENSNCKASREIKVGQIVDIRIGALHKKVQAISLIDKRINAKLVSECYIDLTPAEEYEKMKALRIKFENRPIGIGRPSKKDYREIEKLKNYLNISDQDYEEYLQSGIFDEDNDSTN